MSPQKDIISAMKQQPSGPSRRALIASGVATAGHALTTPAFRRISYPQTRRPRSRFCDDRYTSTPAGRNAQIAAIPNDDVKGSNRTQTAASPLAFCSQIAFDG